MEASDYITIGLGLATLALSLYTALKVHNFDKKKDFEDLIYQRRFDAYVLLTKKLYNLFDKLSIDGEIFNHIYEAKSDNQWMDYLNSRSGEIEGIFYDLNTSLDGETCYISTSAINSTNDVIEIVESYLDIAMLRQPKKLRDIENKMYDLITLTVNSYRHDLGIELLDDSLAKRMGRKKPSKGNM